MPWAREAGGRRKQQMGEQEQCMRLHVCKRMDLCARVIAGRTHLVQKWWPECL